MQKVEGSSPFSRFAKAPQVAGFLVPGLALIVRTGRISGHGVEPAAAFTPTADFEKSSRSTPERTPNTALRRPRVRAAAPHEPAGGPSVGRRSVAGEPRGSAAVLSVWSERKQQPGQDPRALARVPVVRVRGPLASRPLPPGQVLRLGEEQVGLPSRVRAVSADSLRRMTATPGRRQPAFRQWQQDACRRQIWVLL